MVWHANHSKFFLLVEFGVWQPAMKLHYLVSVVYDTIFAYRFCAVDFKIVSQQWKSKYQYLASVEDLLTGAIGQEPSVERST